MRTILFFTEAMDATEERPTDTMTTTSKQINVTPGAISGFEILGTIKRVCGVEVVEVSTSYYMSLDLSVTVRQIADENCNMPRRGRWIIESADANSDFISSKREALAAMADYIAAPQPAAPALSLMERMARAAEATRPAGCKTLALG